MVDVNGPISSEMDVDNVSAKKHNRKFCRSSSSKGIFDTEFDLENVVASMQEMICLCLNVRRLGNHGTFLVLRQLVQCDSSDLIFLSETKLTLAKAESICVELKFHGCFLVACRGKSGGLLLLWRDSINVTIKSFSDVVIYFKALHLQVSMGILNLLPDTYLGFFTQVSWF